MTLSLKRQCQLFVFAALIATTLTLPALAFETPAREAILIDAETGTVLFEKNANVPMPPASMSKMMALYVLFDRIKSGRLSLNDTMTVSKNAWEKGGAASGGSTMFLNPNEQVRVEDLVRGIIIQSGNDASIVVAEGISGTEEAFVQEMTKAAKNIGLRDSTFRNATGLPDSDHRMSARDLATLAYHMINDFPEFYHFYSEKEFQHNGIRQGNRNPLLYKSIGVDGLKTGHTENAGFCLVASAKQGERRLILVVGGLSSMQERSDESERILSWGFRQFDNYTLFKPGETVTSADVWLGQQETVPLVSADGVTVTLPRNVRQDMKVTANFDGPIPAPIRKGDRLAVLSVSAPDVETVQVPLVAGASVERLGMFGRLGVALAHLAGVSTH
ncbi:MAG: D-alanyl-D-alanine carboxypeptidase [Rhodospirillales bacterium]|nr:D-alanyl-D-alanine carboxypeptidase [Rhodospirillales bacterium]